MSRTRFLDNWATPGKHYDIHQELKDAMLSDDSTRQRDAVRHPKATPDIIEAGFKSSHWNVVSAAAGRSDISSDIIHRALQRHIEPEIMQSLASHPNISDSDHQELLRSDYFRHRAAAVSNEKTTPEQVMHALHDSHRHVREIASVHLNIPHEGVEKASTDDEVNVRLYSAASDKATHKSLMNNIQDVDPRVGRVASRNPKIGDEHLQYALDNNPSIARHIIDNGGMNISDGIIQKALTHPDKDVAHAAYVEHSLRDVARSVKNPV